MCIDVWGRRSFTFAVAAYNVTRLPKRSWRRRHQSADELQTRRPVVDHQENPLNFLFGRDARRLTNADGGTSPGGNTCKLLLSAAIHLKLRPPK
jgi:hypothetical protein